MSQDAYQQGLSRLQAGDHEGAIQSFDRALRQQPGFADAFWSRAKARFGLGDTRGAIADYTQALQCRPSPEAHLGRALVKLSVGEPQAAIADANQALTLTADLPAAYNLMATAYRKLGQVEPAIAAYKQAAQGYINQKDKASAQRCLKAIAQLQPPGQAAGQPSAASGLIDPNDFFQQAVDKRERGHYSAALADFDWMIQADPKDAQAYCQRGLIWAQLGNAQSAIKDLAQAVRLAPTDHQIQAYRAQVRLALGDAQGAIADLTHVLDLSGDNAQWLMQRGQAFQAVGDYRRALDDCSRALQLKGDEPTLYETRGKIRQDFEDGAGAIADYQHAANLWFNQGNWKRYQKALETVKQLQQHSKSSTPPIPPPGQPDTPSTPTRTEELRRQLLRLVGGTWPMAERLLTIARDRHPGQNEDWYLKKVIADLERDR
ncbi:MAG: tetratricopeptide repeat protein [Cyanobacteria bacterium P01_A01_bin.123]